MTETLTRRQRTNPKERDKLAKEYAKRYKKGETIRGIALDVDRSFGWVRGLLKDHGVELRGRGKPKQTAKRSRKRNPKVEDRIATVETETAETEPTVLS